MSPENLLAFIATTAILTVTPGLDTAVVLRTAALSGSRHGISAALGIGVGCLCWGTAAAFGLGALLFASPAALAILKITGAGYLVWVGVKLLVRPRRSLAEMAVGDSVPRRSLWCAARRGFTTNVLNPKVGLFYITVLPQFVPAAEPLAALSIVLACIHVVLAVVWLIVLAVMAESVRQQLGRPGMLPVIDRVTGGVFVGVGLHLTQM